MYFGLSFSRVGADFRALIAPIFVKTVVNNFSSAIKKATKKFDADMEKFILSKNITTIHAPHSKDQKPQNLKPVRL